MPRTRTITASLAALTAALAIAPGAGAQSTTGSDAQQAAKLALKGAYLYVNHEVDGKDYVKLVFRAAQPLPRRYDGSIQAGAAIEGVRGSIGSVVKGAPIYTGAQMIKSGKISALIADGQIKKIAAKVGRSYRISVFTRDGQTVTKTLKLRTERPGDDTGKPLR
jgi:hypothetical protein